MAKIGYARVSRGDQHPEVQSQRLDGYGCERVFTDHGASGARASRPAWDECLAYLRPGDVLACIHLDRIGRSMRNLVDIAEYLKEHEVDLVVLDQGIDTTTPAGKLVYHILSAVGEWERAMIIERTKNGLGATKARGRNGGRKNRLTPTQVEYVKHLRANGYSIGRIQDELANGKGRPGRTTIYRALGMTSDDGYQEAQAQ